MLLQIAKNKLSTKMLTLTNLQWNTVGVASYPPVVKKIQGQDNVLTSQ